MIQLCSQNIAKQLNITLSLSEINTKITEINDGVEAETRKTQASFKISLICEASRTLDLNNLEMGLIFL